MENNYEKILGQFKMHYKEKFGVQIDDDILYLLIRINEMHKDLKKDIKNVPEIRFRSGWDYFLYGLGSKLHWILSVFIFSTLIFLLL
ncbi:hypothetical protein [Niabella hirudinis]|uniref:hypothetical protein n=1 Tax=Niabella hirudinis TaxID=1285929 RepID=UPI003EBEA281